MNSVAKILCLLVLTVGCANAAQLYRWVDGKGNVEWRDTPPPISVPAKQIEQRKVGGNVIDTSDAPYSVQLAAKNHPVTFWGSADCGKLCADARALLARRGIPYSEKDPRADLAAFKKISPASEIPILQVGTIVIKGYLESEYDSTLDSAGYPRTAIATRPKPAADGAPAVPANTPPAAAK